MNYCPSLRQKENVSIRDFTGIFRHYIGVLSTHNQNNSPNQNVVVTDDMFKVRVDDIFQKNPEKYDLKQLRKSKL